jgi:hypothetical protein
MGKISTTTSDGSKVDVNQQLINQGFAERFGE